MGLGCLFKYLNKKKMKEKKNKNKLTNQKKGGPNYCLLY